MLPLLIGAAGSARRCGCSSLGAHSDDIEIGCGGTLLRLVEQGAVAEVWWVVLSGETERAAEAQASAEAMLEGVDARVIVRDFRDGFFPYDGRRDQGVLRGAQARVPARRDLHPPAGGPAPGPPARSAS